MPDLGPLVDAAAPLGAAASTALLRTSAGAVVRRLRRGAGRRGTLRAMTSSGGRRQERRVDMKRGPVALGLLLLAAAGCKEKEPPPPTATSTVAAPAVATPPSAASAPPAAPAHFVTDEGASFDAPATFRAERSGLYVDASRGARIEVWDVAYCGRSLAQICGPKKGEAPGWQRSVTKAGCLETGHRQVDGGVDEIVWMRTRVMTDEAVEVVFMAYPTARKSELDPVVELVSRSWKLPNPAPSGFYCAQQR